MNDINKIVVNGTQYDIANTVTTINSKSGEIGASDIASVLTTAGYALTDTTYEQQEKGTAAALTDLYTKILNVLETIEEKELAIAASLTKINQQLQNIQ